MEKLLAYSLIWIMSIFSFMGDTFFYKCSFCKCFSYQKKKKKPSCQDEQNRNGNSEGENV